jgi:pimeloyl-ACP methyl ester carboxylesterase
MNIDYVVLPMLLGIFAVLIGAVCLHRLRALRLRPYSRSRKLTERNALFSICVLIVSIAASCLFNAIAIHRFWKSHPPAGSMVMIGQYKMHIRCLGNGSPTLVLETGLGNDSLIWGGLQENLAQTTRVCAYDRAGFGWSAGRPGPRDADHIVTELHDLLLKTGINGPIVLMGHSIGGLYIRDYASLYPAQVRGLIFIDSASPLQDKNLAFAAGGGSGPPAWLLRAAMVAGVPRIIGMCSGGKPGPQYLLKKERAEHICGMHYNSMSAELDSFDRSGEEALRSRSFGDLPILVFSHDPAKLLQGHHTATDIARQQAWSDMQTQIKHLSSNSRQIIAIGSTHYVMNDRPDLVEKEVSLFLQSIRGGVPQALPNGATIRE